MRIWKYLFGILFLFAAAVFLAGLTYNKNLRLIACNVGEGDASLFIYKTTEVLIDGGPNSKVMDCLAKYMPFWDREIELVILTHPESDHFYGLMDVFKTYKVDTFLRNKLVVSNETYGLLEKLVGGSGARVVEPANGMVIRAGLLHLDIVVDEEVRKGENKDKLNLYSIISIVKYGDFEALMTGDYEFEGKESVLNEIKKKISKNGVDYIKIPHHGSKNGLTQKLLEISKPRLAVISVGKNQWGHPVKEVLDMIADSGAMTLRTDKAGNIEVVSDGLSFWCPTSGVGEREMMIRVANLSKRSI
jgi:competence protein ComEC